MTHAVSARGLSKRFADHEVLRGIDLDLPEGVTTAVVGESGCGKTTLLQLVNGALVADGGALTVLGETLPVTDPVTFRRRMGYAVQGAGLFPHLTARNNVTLLARLCGWPGDRVAARYAELLAQMGLTDEVNDRYPHQLSGGQQQRLGLCRALMLQPELLLLDEPFSAIDPITRVAIYDEFRTVQQSLGVSTILVTHDMREAARLSQHLVILRQGQVEQAGATDAVIAEPASAYVDSLVRSQL